jgi:hypothetical protein
LRRARPAAARAPRQEFGFEMIMTTHRYLLLRMNNNKKTDAPIDETKQKFAQT